MHNCRAVDSFANVCALPKSRATEAGLGIVTGNWPSAWDAFHACVCARSSLPSNAFQLSIRVSFLVRLCPSPLEIRTCIDRR